MNRAAGLAAATVVLVGCSTSPPRSAADNLPASAQGPPIAHGYLDRIGWTETSGGLPSISWPKFQAGLAARANQAELAIIWRGHELRERHPGATPIELAQMLVREDVWEQKATFVQPARRTVVIQEALGLW